MAWVAALINFRLVENTTDPRADLTQAMWKVLNKSSSPEYFSPHLGEYVNVLSALEKLNVAILKAMDKTKEVGGDGLNFCMSRHDSNVMTWADINNSQSICQYPSSLHAFRQVY